MVCGDGEYIIYTAMALRNKSFGSAQEFVWSNDSSVYAIREGSSTVKIFKNFKEQKSFKPDFGAEGKGLCKYWWWWWLDVWIVVEWLNSKQSVLALSLIHI